jgi:hypothetical protein
MIDFGKLKPAQKRRIDKVLDLYLTERRDFLIERVVNGTIGTGLRLRPGDKLSLMIDVEIPYAQWDKILNSKIPLKHVLITPILDGTCLRKAYELCRGAKRKKEVEADRARSVSVKIDGDLD